MLTPVKVAEHGAFSALIQRAFENYARLLGREMSNAATWLKPHFEAGHCYWVGGQDVGVVVALNGPEAELDSLAVDPAAQGHGKGTRALQAVEAHARTAGSEVIKLYTAQPHTRLVAFYSRHGYRVERVGPAHHGRDPYPRIFMFKSLN